MRPFRNLFPLYFLIILPVFCAGQSMTYLDGSVWERDSLIDTLDWIGASVTNPVTICVREGNNHRNGFPDFQSVYNYSYQESWFETWWDDAGILTPTSLTPPGLSVWSMGGDTIHFCFSKVVEGDSNFLYFHQVDFSNTQITIEASLCGVPVNHNLVELNQSSGFPSFVTNPSQTVFSNSAGASRRHLVRFNQDFDYVRVIENNPGDLLVLGFMGYGNFKGAACLGTCPCESNPLLSLGSIQLEATLLEDEVLLSWEGNAVAERYFIEKMEPAQQWQGLEEIVARTHGRFSFTDKMLSPGENIYRLRWLDGQGETHYSSLAYIYYSPTVGIKLFPNPLSGNQLHIHLDRALGTGNIHEVSFIDQQGRRIFLPARSVDSFRIELNTKALAPGLYYINLRFEDGNYVSRRIMIQR